MTAEVVVGEVAVAGVAAAAAAGSTSADARRAARALTRDRSPTRSADRRSNAAPYQLRPDVATTQPQYAANTYGGTFGGPLKIPGLYADTKGRTNFQLNYTGNESNNVFDQYATVPTDAMRQGNFSGSSIQLIDPTTGQPFAGNQIPANRINPGAATLLGFIPAPNLPGTTQNYHVSTTAHSSSEAVSARLIQNLSPNFTPGGRGGFGFGRGGGGGGFGGGGGRGGQSGPRHERRAECSAAVQAK